jgi:hypothetical protein
MGSVELSAPNPWLILQPTATISLAGARLVMRKRAAGLASRAEKLRFFIEEGRTERH